MNNAIAITLDDVGKTVALLAYDNPGLKNRTVNVIMTVVAPNGDHCAIFGNNLERWKVQQAEAVCAFMEGHCG